MFQICVQTTCHECELIQDKSTLVHNDATEIRLFLYTGSGIGQQLELKLYG